MIRAVAVISCLFGAASTVGAAPQTTETVTYYTVTGDTFSEIRKDLARNAQKGTWGRTRWWIEWSAECEVSIEITITLPTLDPAAGLSDRDRRIWDQMIVALIRHEELHAEHGRRAAAEIQEAKCRAPQDIIEKWSEQDRILDRLTNNGVTQGVTLPRE